MGGLSGERSGLSLGRWGCPGGLQSLSHSPHSSGSVLGFTHRKRCLLLLTLGIRSGQVLWPLLVVSFPLSCRTLCNSGCSLFLTCFSSQVTCLFPLPRQTIQGSPLSFAWPMPRPQWLVGEPRPPSTPGSSPGTLSLATVACSLPDHVAVPLDSFLLRSSTFYLPLPLGLQAQAPASRGLRADYSPASPNTPPFSQGVTAACFPAALFLLSVSGLYTGFACSCSTEPASS